MTLDEAQWLLKNIRSPIVKIFSTEGPAANKQHGMPARFLRLEGEHRAVVQPFGHKKEEIVPLNDLRKYKSRLPEGFRDGPPLADKSITHSIGEKLMNSLEQANPPVVLHGRNKYTPDQWDEYRKLLRMGKTWRDAAIITQINEKTAYARLKEEFPRQGPRKKTEYKKVEPEIMIDIPSQEISIPIPAPAPVYLAPVPQQARPVKDNSKATLVSTIRQVLGLPIPDTSKLLAIEGLVSHE